MTTIVASTIDEILVGFEHHPDATLVAGGTDLMVEANARRRAPTGLIAIDRVRELRACHVDEVVRLGAAVTCTDIIARLAGGGHDALVDAARTVGSPLIRNAATIGGNLATGSPAADLVCALAALDARVLIADGTHTSEIPVTEFLVGPKRTTLEPGHVITHVEFDLADAPSTFLKVGIRNAMTIAIVNCAASLSGTLLRVAIGAAAPTVIRATSAEQWFAGTGLDVAAIPEFAKRAALETRPIDDHRSTASYRRHAAEVLVRRAATRVLRASPT